MSAQALKQRVLARDRLALGAESSSTLLCQEALGALRRGDLAAVESAIRRHDATMRTLVENLGIYQAELHAQAAELDEGHARIEQLLSRFSTLFANMPVAEMLVAANGVVVEANDHAGALFALQPRAPATRFLHRMVDAQQFQTLVRPAFLRATVDRVTSLHGLHFVAEDGRRFVGDLHITAMPQAEGEPPQYACAAIDTTEQIAAQQAQAAREAAEIANRAKTAFLSRMSHELRTPLNAILGFAQLMRMEAEAGDLTVKPHRAELIETAARHLLELINEVIDVSQIEAGRMRVNLVRLDAAAVVAECVPLLQATAAQTGVALEVRPTDDAALWVRADRLRLKEVLINLLSNAVKYNRPEGRVTVSLQRCGEAVELAVADTGRGLDAQQLEGLFQPFNRLGAEATTVQGSGMGLFVSKRFVELMGAALEVRSEVGVGSTFTLRLPVAPL